MNNTKVKTLTKAEKSKITKAVNAVKKAYPSRNIVSPLVAFPKFDLSDLVSAKKAKMDKEMKDKAEAQEIKASEEVAQPVAQEISTTQEVVEQAVDNGSKASIEIPNSAPVSQPSVKEKYAAAFGLDGFELTK